MLPLLAILAASTACTARNGTANFAKDANAAAAANGAAHAAPENVGADLEGLPPEMRARAGLNGQELRLSGNGLETASPGLHSSGRLEFGQSREEVLAAVSAIRGQPTETGRNAECPSGPIDFAAYGPLVLNFRDGKFVGWVMDDAATPPIEEEYGLRVGWTREDLTQSDQGPATFENGSLGPEFDFGGIGGLLDGNGPNARVTELFSGVTCYAR